MSGRDKLRLSVSRGMPIILAAAVMSFASPAIMSSMAFTTFFDIGRRRGSGSCTTVARSGSDASGMARLLLWLDNPQVGVHDGGRLLLRRCDCNTVARFKPQLRLRIACVVKALLAAIDWHAKCKSARRCGGILYDDHLQSERAENRFHADRPHPFWLARPFGITQ